MNVNKEPSQDLLGNKQDMHQFLSHSPIQLWYQLKYQNMTCIVFNSNKLQYSLNSYHLSSGDPGKVDVWGLVGGGEMLFLLLDTGLLSVSSRSSSATNPPLAWASLAFSKNIQKNDIKRPKLGLNMNKSIALKVDIFTRQLPTQKHQFNAKRTDFRKISKKSSVLKNIDNLRGCLLYIH